MSDIHSSFSHFAADEGEAIWYAGSLLTVKANAESTGGAFDLVDELLPAGWAPPPHIHHREDESFYVIEGEITFFCGDQTFQAKPGAFVFLPRGVIHSFRVEGTTPAHMMMMCSPAGFVGFFRELGEPADERVLPPQRPLDIAKLRSVSLKYGAEIPERAKA